MTVKVKWNAERKSGDISGRITISEKNKQVRHQTFPLLKPVINFLCTSLKRVYNVMELTCTILTWAKGAHWKGEPLLILRRAPGAPSISWACTQMKIKYCTSVCFVAYKVIWILGYVILAHILTRWWFHQLHECSCILSWRNPLQIDKIPLNQNALWHHSTQDDLPHLFHRLTCSSKSNEWAADGRKTSKTVRPC
jgi:hypothetical protein